MAVYAIAYDLNNPGKNYATLIRHIETMPHFHAQKSLWLVEYPSTPTALRDSVAKFLDVNDTLFVSLVTREWASSNMAGAAKWLQARGL